MMMLSEAAKALSISYESADQMFTSVCTDSRQIESGTLFVALRGEHFDGHDYVDSAFCEGAVGAIVDHPVESDIEQLVVKDTRLALGALATYWRRQLNITVVALTGSNGKTTVKEMTAAILSQMGRVIATKGNLNNDIGLPLTLLRFRQKHDFAVVEMGANHPGEIAYLTQLTKPDAALVNNAAPAHLQGFGSLRGVAEAKGEIFSGLDDTGIAIINADDDFADYWRSICGNRKIIAFGLQNAADVTGKWSAETGGGELNIQSPIGDADIKLKVGGEHNACNALAASSLAIAVGANINAIVKGLQSFESVAGRLEVKKTFNNALIIDDTYNANPSSLEAAMNVLAGYPGKRILVLGDMGELGDLARSLHESVGQQARDKQIDMLITIGELAGLAVKTFGQGAKSYGDIDELILELKQEINSQVVVLVKGSRSMHMERVVDALMQEKNENSAGAASCC